MVRCVGLAEPVHKLASLHSQHPPLQEVWDSGALCAAVRDIQRGVLILRVPARGEMPRT